MPRPKLRFPTGYLFSPAPHAGLAGWLFLPLSVELETEPWKGVAAVQILVPPLGPEQQRRIPAGGVGSRRIQPLPGSPEALRGLEIVVQPDPQHEMIPVLRRHRGLLGFALASRPRFLVEVFDAENHVLVQGGQSLDAWLAFRIWEPESWPELGHLANPRKEERIAYALFPLSFQAVILAEIRAPAKRQSCRGPVKEAVIAFLDDPTLRR